MLAISWSIFSAMPVTSTVGAAFSRSMSRASTRRSGRNRGDSSRASRASAVCSAASAVGTLPLICSSCAPSVIRRSTSTSTASSRPRDRSAYSCSSASRWLSTSASRDSSTAACCRADRASASARAAVSVAADDGLLQFSRVAAQSRASRFASCVYDSAPTTRASTIASSAIHGARGARRACDRRQARPTAGGETDDAMARGRFGTHVGCVRSARGDVAVAVRGPVEGQP